MVRLFSRLVRGGAPGEDPVDAFAPVLDEVGPSRLTARLAEAGATLVLPRREAPGLAEKLWMRDIETSQQDAAEYAADCRSDDY